MRYSILLIAFLVIVMGCGTKMDKKSMIVTTHDHITIITNPAAGVNYFPAWGVFPANEKKVRRIFMDVILGHPDSLKIAHWDYLDHITIRRAGGINGDSLNLEIGRMITPYGSNFKKDWEWKWRIDVTDFASLLRDSVEIEYMHSGYESVEVGWDLSINFEFIFGDPLAELVTYNKLYAGGYSYGNPEKPITESLAPVKIAMDDAADFGRIRIQHTGHGMDAPKFCSEFCSRWREVLVDDQVIDFRDMWKECADNNLYPQGGTWIFDRAYWCPGDLQKPDLIDFPISKKEHVIDFEIEPYIASDRIQATERINAVLFQYEAPNKENDVALEEILVPSNALELNRLNPSCFEPQLVIRNLGSDPLQSITINYGTKGFEEKSYSWSGSLAFYEEEVVTLPGLIDFKHGENVFFAELEKPNGRKDQWPSDNTMNIDFTSPKEMPEKIVLTFKSNKAPKDNIIQVFDEDKNIVFERLQQSIDSNTIYIDTLSLPEGKYRIALQDTAHNGLEFWYMPQFGFGYMYMSDLNGRILHRFESDCGVGEKLDFVTKQNPRIDTAVEQSFFMLHPRRIRTETQLMVKMEKPVDGNINILADGDTIKVIPFTDVHDKIFDVSLEEFKDGRYVIELMVEGESKLKQRISKTSGRR